MNYRKIQPAAIYALLFLSVFGIGYLIFKGNPKYGSSITSIFSGNAAKIQFKSEKHNFGTIRDGESLKYYFRFQNTGKSPLIIYAVTPSCGCTVASWPKKPIMPGTVDSIGVTYKTHGSLGYTDKMITVESNSTTPKKTVILEGTVIKIYKRDTTASLK